MTTKTTRIAPGIYSVRTSKGRFEIERYEDGSWLVFEFANREHATREYRNDYATKRAALESIEG